MVLRALVTSMIWQWPSRLRASAKDSRSNWFQSVRSVLKESGKDAEGRNNAGKLARPDEGSGGCGGLLRGDARTFSCGAGLLVRRQGNRSRERQAASDFEWSGDCAEFEPAASVGAYVYR